MIIGSSELAGIANFVAVDHDPTTTTTDCASGSIIVSTLTGKKYWKSDDGPTTNVEDFERVILRSPNTHRWEQTIDNLGVRTWTDLDV